MNFKRFWATFKARNCEFLRDRAGFGWNILFPFLIVAGFGVIFGGKEANQYKIGVIPLPAGVESAEPLDLARRFGEERYFKFIRVSNQENGLEKLRHHQIDFLIEQGSTPLRYWVSDASPRGYIVEKLFQASLKPPVAAPAAQRLEITGREIRHIDWLFPGIMAMNMMFSALWGVGYIVVRYRKNGVLKRFKATPLTALEYLSAQMLSRICVLMSSLVIVWFGCDLLFDFQIEGSYLDLLLIFLTGGFSLTAMGLLVAARGISEEFTNGLLNFISWPMMFLSEVWFSLEGAPQWVKAVSQAFPLTHMIRALREVMNDGVGLIEVGAEMTILVSSTLVFLFLGARFFSWTR